MPSESRPWRSISCACPPEQAAKLTEELRRHYGSSAYYDPQTGEAVATTREGRNAILKHNGAIDKSGGYHDR